MRLGTDNLIGMGFFKGRQERKAQVAQAEGEYSRLVGELVSDDPGRVGAATAALESNQAIVALHPDDRVRLGSGAFRRYADALLADDILSEHEEAIFSDVAERLGITDESLRSQHMDILHRLYVAKINDGRFSVLEEPQLMTKPGESVYMETVAMLLKEVAIHEWQGGYGGVSFRVAKGVRFSTGKVRGKSVVVGSELKIEDQGILSVTSKRIAFLGSRKSVEVPYTKLMGMQVFSDGLTVQSSSRQNAVMFKVDDGLGEAVAATVNAAAQVTL